MVTDPIWHRDSIGSLKPMQESSRGADHGSDLRLHVSLYAGNCSEHVYTLLIGYRSGGTPGFPQNFRARDWIAGRRRGSSACQCPSNLLALRVARRCSPVGFDRQQLVTSNFLLLPSVFVVFSRLDSFSPSQHKGISMLVDCFLSLWFRGLINLGGIL